MGATLDALQRLQEIETQLRSVREQIESKRRSVQTHKRRLVSLERQITEVHDLIRKAQAEADRLELQRKTQEEHITRLREMLNRARTNKEYAAILTQLNTDKASTLKLEDAVLSALGRVDGLKKQEADLRASLQKDQARAGEVAQSAAELDARLSQELTGLELQRQEAAGSIPPEALNMFERACERHEGEAMAAVEQVHPKRAEYTCGGCNMSVPLETINALQSRDVVRPCETCLRILYLDTTAGVPVL